MKTYLYIFSVISLGLMLISATVYTQASEPGDGTANYTAYTPGSLFPGSVRVISPFGLRPHPISGKELMHLGIDFALPTGTPVRAAEAGVIEIADAEALNSTYGSYVRIAHDGGFQSLYARLSRIEAVAGSSVQKGEIIGYSGNMEAGAEPHIHLEVLHNDTHIDPMLFLHQETH